MGSPACRMRMPCQPSAAAACLQAISLAKRPHIVVGTPGRVVDHLSNTKGFSLKGLKHLVGRERQGPGARPATAAAPHSPLRAGPHAGVLGGSDLPGAHVPLPADRGSHPALFMRPSGCAEPGTQVLDEADRLLNMDFEQEIDQILKVIPKVGGGGLLARCRRTPPAGSAGAGAQESTSNLTVPPACRPTQERRTQLFSATMTSKVAKLQRACLRDPVKGEPQHSWPGGGAWLRAPLRCGGDRVGLAGGWPLVPARMAARQGNGRVAAAFLNAVPLPWCVHTRACLQASSAAHVSNPHPPPPTRVQWRLPPSTAPWRRCASSTCLCPPSTRTATSPLCSQVRGPAQLARSNPGAEQQLQGAGLPCVKMQLAGLPWPARRQVLAPSVAAPFSSGASHSARCWRPA